jgi:hypothetical protein
MTTDEILENLPDSALRDIIEDLHTEIFYRSTHTNSEHRKDQLAAVAGYLYLAFLCIDNLSRTQKELPKDEQS